MIRKGTSFGVLFIREKEKYMRTYIFEKNERGGDDNTYEWVAPGVEPQKDILQDLPAEVCARWYERFCENKHIVIRDLEDIRDKDPLQYENIDRLITEAERLMYRDKDAYYEKIGLKRRTI